MGMRPSWNWNEAIGMGMRLVLHNSTVYSMVTRLLRASGRLTVLAIIRGM